MKEPSLWVSNRNGSVFTAGASSRYICQLSPAKGKKVRVKRLAASEWCAWAIGHDHRVYIYVIGTDVPIRVPVTTYENQVIVLDFKVHRFHYHLKKKRVQASRNDKLII